MAERMPIGWLDLVTDLRLDLQRGYPAVTVVEMTSDRGWLHVRVDDSGMDPAARLRMDRLIQGYVTRSLSTCMCCGSHHGFDRGARREIVCDECDEVSCDA